LDVASKRTYRAVAENGTICAGIGPPGEIDRLLLVAEV
jgi:hypothetical protein